MNNAKNYTNLAASLIVDEKTKDITERATRVLKDADLLKSTASKWKNVLADKAQGHNFEQLEVMKFNYDALKKGSNLHAKTTASMGSPTDPVDIIISDGKKTVRDVQAKSCNTAANSAYSLSKKKYEEMQRLAPSDQHEKIEELLKKRIKAGTLKAEDYQDTLDNLTKSLSHDDVSSSGTTYKESLDSTQENVAKEISREFKSKSVLTDMHESGKQAAKFGASVSASLSLATSSYQLISGEMEFGDAVTDVIISATKGGATGYVTTALSKGLTHTANEYLTESTAKALLRSNAPVSIASGVVNAGKSMLSYMIGEIDSDQLIDEINHCATTSISAFYYAALGQIAIPIPVVGSLVGCAVGYCIGNLIHQAGIVALGDSLAVKVAKDRRRQIEAMCLTAIPKMRKERLELEATLDMYFSNRREIFDFSFSEMEESLYEMDVDRYINGLNSIGEKFNIILQFQTFEEFDDFMMSDDDLIF